VTFVIPCYNHGLFVKDAVASCLRQEDAQVHVVVVDDGSDDSTTAGACDKCAHEHVTIIHQPNRGLPAARNRGAQEAKDHGSTFLVFLDADDWVEPTFVRKLHAKFQDDAQEGEKAAGNGATGSASHAYCQERLVELGTGVWRVPQWDPITLMVTNLHPVTALVRRDCFEAVGGFDEAMTEGYEDWDLWLKFAHRGWHGVRVREPLFIWRRHSHKTMVMQVIHNHEVLYQRLMDNHREMFTARRRDLLVRANTMLRRFDVNWIDETGEAIPLAALRKSEEDYERMVAVRLHHAAHRFLNAMPAPVAGLLERLFAAVHRAGPTPRTMLPGDLPLEKLHTP
jgi:glycosyltransferase involved in cell wall biosynthesis